MPTFNPNILNLKPAATIEIFHLANKLREQGKDVFDYGVGEMQPDVAIPRELIEFVKQAMDDGFTRYCDPRGMLQLRTALAQDMKTNFGVDLPADHFAVCPGAKDILFAAMNTLLQPGDRVLVFKPSYEAFSNLPFMLTGEDPILVDADRDFQPNVDRFQEALKSNPRVKVVILNSPNNPTGTVYSEDSLRGLAAVLEEFPDVWVISDEVYRVYCYDERIPHVSMAQFLPRRTIVIGAASKEVAGTGLRLGFGCCGDKQVVDLIATVNGNTTSCVNQSVQVGMANFLALDADLGIRKQLFHQLKRKRDLLVEQLAIHAPRFVLAVSPPNGAFYVFPDISYYLEQRSDDCGVAEPADTESKTFPLFADDKAFAQFMIEQSGVVTLPGSTFDCPAHLRFAYASIPFDSIEPGIRRLGEALARLERGGVVEPCR